MAASEAGTQGGSPAGGTRLACKYCAFTLRAMVSFQDGPLCSQDSFGEGRRKQGEERSRQSEMD